MKRVLVSGMLLALVMSVSTVVPARAEGIQPNEVRHIVKPGDNLLQLSKRYGVSVGALAVANGLVSTVISAGQQLIIPGDDWPENPIPTRHNPGEQITYVVRRGDYLGLVAREYGTSIDAIMHANGLASQLIVTNQFLRIPVIMAPALDVLSVEMEEQARASDVEEDELVGVVGGDDELRMRQELHGAGYPYAYTESEVEITRVYSETVGGPSATGSHDDIPVPSDVVAEYWTYVSEKRYEEAWVLLTEGFRRRMHDGDLSDYARGYNDMGLCKVHAKHMKTANHGGQRAVVSAIVTYETGADCVPLEFELALTLEPAAESGEWAIDAVVVTMAEDDVVPVSVPTGGISKWIDVDIGSQTVTAMEGDTPVRELVASTGIDRYPTVTGQFRVYVKHRHADMRGVDLGVPWHLRDVPYVMYFYRGYGVHGTYWHDNFGTPMSHGCINLSIPDAGWLYDFSSVGTLVNIHF